MKTAVLPENPALTISPIIYKGFSSVSEYLQLLVDIQHMRLNIRAASEIKEGDEPQCLETSLKHALESFEASVRNTRIPLPLEALKAKFSLSDADMTLLRTLFCLHIDWGLFRCFHNIFSANYILVGAVVEMLTESVEKKLEFLNCLSDGSQLIHSGIVEIDGYRRCDLLNSTISIPARILDYASGNSCKFNSSLDFIKEIKPTTNTENVILPGSMSNDILELVRSYPNMVANAESASLSELLNFGGGLALLFYGESGTGKTMMARAISTMTGKPLLSVNRAALEKRDLDNMVAMLYREAELRDGIVFIDECDDNFRDSSDLSNDLLKEIELHSVITIMTTNEPEKLDPALNRRMMLKAHFPLPDEQLRQKLWEIHIPDSVALSHDADIALLSKKYSLSGGHIRNAVQMAVGIALKNSVDGNSISLSLSDLENAAKCQSSDMNNPEEQNSDFDGIHTFGSSPYCELSNEEQDEFSKAKATLETFVASSFQHSASKHNPGMRNQGLKILVKSPNFHKGMIFAKGLVDDLGIELFSKDIISVLRLLDSFMNSSSRRDRREYFRKDVFENMKSSPSALILNDKKGNIWLENHCDSNLSPRWEPLEDKFISCKSIVIYVTSANRIPENVFLGWFHYQISLNSESTHIRQASWKNELGQMGLNDSLIEASFNLVKSVPIELFENAMYVIRLEKSANPYLCEERVMKLVQNAVSLNRKSSRSIFGEKSDQSV